jgi:hypothetical protein
VVHFIILKKIGGTYKVSIKYKGNGLPKAEREFEVRSVSNPRMISQIEFLRKGYGPGIY